MAKSITPWLGFGVSASLAIGCGAATRSDPSPIGLREKPPYSVVAAPQTSLPIVPGTVMAQKNTEIAVPEGLFAPRVQTVPAVVARPSSAMPGNESQREEQDSAIKTWLNSVVPVKATSTATFYHSDDYSTLVGVLYFNPRQDRWRLRYSANDDDKFGGSVTLAGDTSGLKNCKDGQTVRIEGKLSPLNRTEISPQYDVRSVTPIK